MSDSRAPDPISRYSPLPELEQSLVLLGKAKSGDREALDRLVGRYYDRVLGLIRARMGARLRRAMESGDIAQETLRVAAQKLDDFVPREHKDIIRWLAAIAEHQIHDACDRVAAQKRDIDRETPLRSEGDSGPPLAARQPSPSSIVAEKERQELLDACISELPPDYRQLVLMRENEECSWEEIQRLTGSPTVHAAQQKYYRAQIKLAQIYRARTGRG